MSKPTKDEIKDLLLNYLKVDITVFLGSLNVSYPDIDKVVDVLFDRFNNSGFSSKYQDLLSPLIEMECRKILNLQGKLHAVKYLREQAILLNIDQYYDIKLCKDIVDQFERGDIPKDLKFDYPWLTQTDIKQMKEHISFGNKLVALKYMKDVSKLYVEDNGIGLKECKEYIDSLEEEIKTNSIKQ